MIGYAGDEEALLKFVVEDVAHFLFRAFFELGAFPTPDLLFPANGIAVFYFSLYHLKDFVDGKPVPCVLPQKAGVDMHQVKFQRGYSVFAFLVVPDRGTGVAPFHVFFHLGAERKEAEFGKVRSGSNNAGRVHAEDPRIYAEAQNVFEKQVAVFDVREALFEHVAAEGVEAVKVAVAQIAFFRQGKEAVEPAAHLSGEFRIDVLRKIIGSYVFNARFRKGNVVFIEEGGEDYFAFQVIFRKDAGRPKRRVGEEGDSVIVKFGDVREVKPLGVGAGVVLQFAASHDADASLAKILHGQRRGRLFGIDLVA